MGRFDNIKTAIDTNIKTNGNQSITGAVLNSVMKQTVDSVDTELTELESQVEKKQDALVDGENIKTINEQSILGKGNIVIQGSGESYDDTEIKNQITQKQDRLISGTNIKTINNQSILGEGNITIQGGNGDPESSNKGSYVERLEIKINFEGELSEEDMAHNAEVFAKASSGDNYIYWTNWMGVETSSIMCIPPMEDYPVFNFVVKGMNMSDIPILTDFIIELYEDGSITTYPYPQQEPIFPIQIEGTFSDFKNALGANDLSSYTLSSPTAYAAPHFSGLPVFGKIDVGSEHVTVQNSTGELEEYRFNILFPYGNRIRSRYIASEEDDRVYCAIIEGAILGIDGYYEKEKSNRRIFSGNRDIDDWIDISTFRVSDGGYRYYTPISSFRELGSSDEVLSYTITIYRNDKFEKWKFNNDGTVEQLS